VSWHDLVCDECAGRAFDDGELGPVSCWKCYGTGLQRPIPGDLAAARGILERMARATRGRGRRPAENHLRRPFVTKPPGRSSEDLKGREVVSIGVVYDVWRETYDLGGRAMSRNPRDRYMTMEVARTKDGHYIGQPDEARYLCDKRGIRPEVRDDTTVCSIGYSEAEGKWFGWSHRALAGFGTREQAERFASEVS